MKKSLPPAVRLAMAGSASRDDGGSKGKSQTSLKRELQAAGEFEVFGGKTFF